ncbi:MAG TPA: hypothetical protein DCW90_25080 [Lachnospiraceae bacterium]|nr:hypothetical protein [Lachnospiraceae bacterium]
MKKKKILSLEDLYQFYSNHRRSVNFSSEKSGYNIAVQTNATFETVASDDSEGLLYGKIRAFHDLTNSNKSHIKTNVLEQKISSMKDRPIMADIIETDEVDEDGAKIKDFSGHTVELDPENDKIIYIEHPVGHFVNPENFHLIYDEEYDRNFVEAECVIYEEYSEACNILRRRVTVDCSVELVIRSCSWDCANKVLILNDFYVQGCTLLGANVKPGMPGSRMTLKDFAESNNSLFSAIYHTEQTQLVETLERLNNTLARFNINDIEQGKEEDNLNNINTTTSTFPYLNSLVIGAEAYSLDDVESVNGVLNQQIFDDSDTSDTSDSSEGTEGSNTGDGSETPEGGSSTDDGDGGTPTDPDSSGTDEDEDDPNSDDEGGSGDDISSGGKKIYKSFELSHDDIRTALYQLLIPYEEADNECYWIAKVYDSYFIYEGCWNEKYFGQKYLKDDNQETITFDGERFELFNEFLTASEKAELKDMRANYSKIQLELNSYKEAEDITDKLTVFEDPAYADYLETNEFKELMSAETIKKFTKDELKDKADIAFAKAVKTNKTFTLNEKPAITSAHSFFGFAKQENNNSFLDGLLKK